MDRRNFLKTAAIAGIAGGVGAPAATAYVPAHNWGHYDFGAGPRITDRLNQGPFPQYPPEAIFPGGDVVMATTPSNEVVPNYGKGLVTYIAGDLGRAEIKSRTSSGPSKRWLRCPLARSFISECPGGTFRRGPAVSTLPITGKSPLKWPPGTRSALASES